MTKAKELHNENPEKFSYGDMLGAPSLSWSPNYLEPSAWIEHIPFAFWLIETIKPATIVELGVYNGTSYFSFCQAIERLNLNTKTYGVDTWKGDAHAGFYENEVYEGVQAHNERNYSKFSTLVRSTFDEASQYFSENFIDILHIDGLHTYDAVKHDFETWMPALSKNAIVVFHDINVRERGFGVYKYWEELRGKYPHFEFDFGFGLGVLALGKTYPVMLQSLFNENKSSEFYSTLKNIFAERGASFKKIIEFDLLKGKTDKLTQNLADQEKENQQLGQKINSILGHWEDEKRRLLQNESFVQLELKQKLDQLIQLHSTNKEKDELITKLEEGLLSKQAVINASEDRLANFEKEVTMLESTFQIELNRRAELEGVLDQRAKLILQLQQDFGRLQQDLERQQENFVALEQDFKVLQTTNRELRQEKESLAGEKEKFEKQLKDSSGLIEDQNRQNLFLSQQLDSVNARLTEIYASDGWKALKRYYNLKGKLLPETSSRYRVLKNMLNKLRGKKEVAEKNYRTQTQAAEQKQIPGSPEIGKKYNVIMFPSFDYPTVSIVIPAYNGWELTYKCLKSIKENTLGVSYEIIIGDDASSDETKDISKYIKNIQVIRNEKNLEFLHNCNKAATYAKGDYILFLNNDTEVTKGWLSSMIELFENDKRVGMVGSKLIYPDGRLQEAGSIIWKDASGWDFAYKQNPEAPEFNYVKEVDYISGASIIIRKALWEEIGGFDERYTPAYCEDSDLAFEVRKHGYRVVYQPLSVVIHYEGFTHGTDETEGIKGKGIKEYQKINNEKFREKWKDTLSKNHFPNGENVFWARDKSQGKKTILVIDHYVPQFDKDAGSKTVFQYLKLFVLLNYNVKFIGDNFYRDEPYTTVLQQIGVEVLYGPWYAANWQEWIKLNSDKFDFVLLNRPHITIKYIDFIREHTKAKILYYGHDLHFIREQKQYEIEKEPALLASSEKWKATESYIFDKADLVLAPSEEEERIIHTLTTQKKTSTILPFFFEDEKEPVTNFAQRNNILFVGGFLHKPNVDAVLWFCNEIWPMVKNNIPGAQFIIVGSKMPDIISKLASEDILIKGYLTDAKLDRLYDSVRIVIVPLRYGAGVKGKLVEALHRGIPIVSTASGIEGLPGDTSFLPPKDNKNEFAEELIKLYNSKNEDLSELSKKEICYIRNNFSMEIGKTKISELLNKISK